MTQQVILTGGSDDLAEIHGDITTEFPADIRKRGRFIFDTGTQIELASNVDGAWRLFNVTPRDVVNTDEIDWELGRFRRNDEVVTVTGDFTEIIWVPEFHVAKVPQK
jgi:hypothetical protein